MRQAEMILERILSWDKERGWVGGVSTTHYDLWTTSPRLQHPLSHPYYLYYLPCIRTMMDTYLPARIVFLSSEMFNLTMRLMKKVS